MTTHLLARHPSGLGAIGLGPSVQLVRTQNGLTLALFDASQFDFTVSPGSGRRAASVIAPDTAAVLDGSMYNPGYRIVYRHFNPARRIDITGSYPARGATMSIVPTTFGAKAVFLSGDHVAPGAKVAIQGYPSLVRNGRITQAGGADSVWRAGFGQMRGGKLFFAIGRMPMSRFAQALLDVGAVEAVYSDGGGSTSLWVGGTRYGDNENRAVPTWLAAEKKLQWPIWAAVGVATLAVLGIVAWRTHKL